MVQTMFWNKPDLKKAVQDKYPDILEFSCMCITKFWPEVRIKGQFFPESDLDLAFVVLLHPTSLVVPHPRRKPAREWWRRLGTSSSPRQEEMSGSPSQAEMTTDVISDVTGSPSHCLQVRGNKWFRALENQIFIIHHFSRYLTPDVLLSPIVEMTWPWLPMFLFLLCIVPWDSTFCYRMYVLVLHTHSEFPNLFSLF